MKYRKVNDGDQKLHGSMKYFRWIPDVSVICKQFRVDVIIVESLFTVGVQSNLDGHKNRVTN